MKKEGNEILYIFFCPELYEDQIKAKERKFEREKEKGNKILRKRKKERIPSDKGWVEFSCKNVKVLKKLLINLSLTIVYPSSGFRFHILSNVTPKILAIFGDFIQRYKDKSLNFRW